MGPAKGSNPLKPINIKLSKHQVTFMPTVTYDTRRNPVTGKVERTGTRSGSGYRERVSGGGYERVSVTETQSSNTLTQQKARESEQRETQAAIDKINQQRIDAGKPTLVGTQPPSQPKIIEPGRAKTMGATLEPGTQGPLTREQYAARQQEQVTSPIFNRPVTRAELEASQASTARIQAAKTSARAEEQAYQQQEYARKNPFATEVSKSNIIIKGKVDVITQKISSRIGETNKYSYLNPAEIGARKAGSFLTKEAGAVAKTGGDITDLAANYKEVGAGVRNTQAKEVAVGLGTGVLLATGFEAVKPALTTVKYGVPVAKAGLTYIGIKYAEKELQKKPQEFGQGIIPNIAGVVGGVGVSAGVARVTRPVVTVSEPKVTSRAIDTTQIFSENPKLRSQSLYGSQRAEQTFTQTNPTIYDAIKAPNKYFGKLKGKTTEGTITTDVVFTGETSRSKGAFDITGIQTVTTNGRSSSRPVEAIGILTRSGKDTTTTVLFDKKVGVTTATKVFRTKSSDVYSAEGIVAVRPATTKVYTLKTEVGELGARQTQRLWSKPKVSTFTSIKESISRTKVEKGSYNYLRTEQVSVIDTTRLPEEQLGNVFKGTKSVSVEYFDPIRLELTGTRKTRTITTASEITNTKSLGNKDITESYKKGYSDLFGTKIPTDNFGVDKPVKSKYMEPSNRLGFVKGAQLKYEALKNKRLTLSNKATPATANVYLQKVRKQTVSVSLFNPKANKVTLRYGNKVEPQLGPGLEKRIVVTEKPLGAFDKRTKYVDKGKPSGGSSQSLERLRTRGKSKTSFEEVTVPNQVFQPEIVPRNPIKYSAGVTPALGGQGLVNRYKSSQNIFAQTRPTDKLRQSITPYTVFDSKQTPGQIIVPEYRTTPRQRQDDVVVSYPVSKIKQDTTSVPYADLYGTPKTPFAGGFTAGVGGGGIGGRGSKTQRGGSDKFSYAPTFTAAFFGIKASKKQRKAILEASSRGATYTGSEVIRPLL